MLAVVVLLVAPLLIGLTVLVVTLSIVSRLGHEKGIDQ